MSENTEIAMKGEMICGLSEQKIQQLEKIANKFQLDNLKTEGNLRKSLLVAHGVAALEEVITDEVMIPIMYLMGRKLGFRTDLDDKPEKYSVADVRSVFIESQLRGLMPAGNQFNIIAKNLYITKEGYTHLLKNLPGLTDFLWTLKAPRVIDKNTVVDFEANWKMNGIAGALAGEIPIHTHPTDKVDGILGKAERKMKYRVFSNITNSEATDDDERDKDDVNNEPLKKSDLQTAAESVEGESK